jgi:hypothetical protein
MISKGAAIMHAFLQPKLPPSQVAADAPIELVVTQDVFTGYISDLEDDSDDENLGMPIDEEDEIGWAKTISESQSADSVNSREWVDIPEGPFQVNNPPALKRHRHDVPVHVARKKRRRMVKDELEKALKMINKVIASKKEVFRAGRNGLQAYRARAIQSHLHMVVHNGRNHIEASERAAESQQFAAKWGGRLVCRWVEKWVTVRELPGSSCGSHTKVYSILEDPVICAELRSYLRTNKWSMDPAKLSKYIQTTSIPAAAEKYVRHLVDEEMPRGLKKYLELELFPRIHYRAVGKGVTLETACQFLHKEGFRFMEHKKSLYYDGHERLDVVEYRQNVFLPAMEKHRERLVEHTVGNVEVELVKTPANYVERRLVLVAHDEMTVQQNDGKKRSWVLNGEHALKKKGVGRGIHLSGVICATKGYLFEAGQTLEYGKNYEGYWTGELFVKQVSNSIL